MGFLTLLKRKRRRWWETTKETRRCVTFDRRSRETRWSPRGKSRLWNRGLRQIRLLAGRERKPNSTRRLVRRRIVLQFGRMARDRLQKLQEIGRWPSRTTLNGSI